MTISISNSLAVASSAVANASSNAAPAPRPQPAPNNAAYTVTLTEAQQVYQLYNQGQQVSQIATSLSLTVEAVNSYLGVTSTTT